MFPGTAVVLALLLAGKAVCLQVDITPAQGEISVGESRFFLCEVIGGAKDINWFSPTGAKIDPGRPDISVIRNDELSSTLTIYNANVEDAGTYKCVASRGNREAEATVNLKIYQKITFTNVPSPQEFTEGDTAVIVCDVSSSPQPTVLWKYKSRKIQFEKDVRFQTLNNNHLQIRGIRKIDEGMYTCEGRIKARGEVDFRSIKVVVNVLPSIRIRQVETNATADMGFSALLACDADGFPEPLVTWSRNEEKLESGNKYSFNEDGSEMTILQVDKLDEGDYTCTAKNKAGETEQELGLKVFVQPKITYLDSQTTTEMEEQVTLTCEATGDPTPTITWSFGSRVFTEGEQELQKRIYQASWTRPEQHKNSNGTVLVRSDARVSSLTLKFPQYSDAGDYLCSAHNSIGEASQSVALEVRYAPKIQGSVVVYTWEGNPTNISCEVLAHPSDVSITWLRDGLQLPNANTSNIRIYSLPSASYLEVNPESQSDFGNYNCTATNEIGTESKEFIVISADVPSAPAITQVEPYSSTAQVMFEVPESSGGVPVLRYRAEWRAVGRGKWLQRVYEVKDGLSLLTVAGLKPETSYEVKMSAINGKGEGESSLPVAFRTETVRYSFTNGIFPFHTEETEGEPSAPTLEVTPQAKGGSSSVKVKWIKQDDGGSPITHYLVRYKARGDHDWKPEIRQPSGSEYVMLTGLEWDTEYDIVVVAENQQGRSKPGILAFRTSSEPVAATDSVENEPGLNTGIIVGVLILVCVLLLLIIDAACCFLNKCGVLMCVCGKPSQTTKAKDVEMAKAAFVQDVSKEPIVEVRTEEEVTANHDAEGHPEPSETTPLTEPERVVDAAAAVVDLPLSETVTDTFELSPASESTTVTSSVTLPVSDPAPTHITHPPIPTINLLVDVGDRPVVQSEDSISVSPSQTPPTPRAVQSGELDSIITENGAEPAESPSHAILNSVGLQDAELSHARLPQDGSRAPGTTDPLQDEALTDGGRILSGLVEMKSEDVSCP